MRTRVILCAAWLAAASFELPAQPQAVYRCGNAYGSQPCEGGVALALEEARPSREAASAAQRTARRDARLADELERERLAREKQAPRAVIFRSSRMADADSAPAPKKKSAAQGKKRNQDFSAVAPGTQRKKN